MASAPNFNDTKRNSANNIASKPWKGAKLTSDKFEEKFANWYSCEIKSQELEIYGESIERSVIMYVIQVSVHLNNASPMIYCIKRRFNNWLNLHEEMVERCSSLSGKIPPGFPSRTITKASTNTIHTRADYFQKYLHTVTHDPQFANCPPLLSFLELNSIVQSLAVGTALNVELSPTHNIHTLKQVISSLVGVIHIRVDLRLSKVMIKGFLGTQAIADALQNAGFAIAYSPDHPNSPREALSTTKPPS